MEQMRKSISVKKSELANIIHHNYNFIQINFIKINLNKNLHKGGKLCL